MKTKKGASLLEDISLTDDELPEGWEIKKIIDITKKVPTVKPESEPEQIFGYVDIGSINNETNQITDFKKILGKEAPSRARQSIQTNDVLFSNVRTYLRNIAIVPDDVDVQVCSTGFTVLRSDGSIEPKFLFYYTLTDGFINQVTPQQTGSQYPATTDRVVKDATITFPPLAEQQRIVARVEALLTQVNAARDRLSRVPLIMKKFRQAVLAAACSGRLTEDYRKTDEWTTVNFRSITINTKDGIKTGPFGSMLKKHEHTSHGVPVFGVENVKHLQFLQKNKIFITEEKAEQLSNYDVKPGDLLLTRSGTVGEICVVPEGISDSRMSCNLMRIRVNLQKINPYFCCYSLYGSPSVLQQISEMCGGSTRNFIDGKILRDLEIPLPPLAEQHEIVRRVGLLFERADAIDREVAAAGRRCERLTQAVLGKTFSGKL